MAVNKGINFRGTSGFVTDGTDETFCLLADGYSTSRGGIVFGWESSTGDMAGPDRSTSVDVRLAGFNGKLNSVTGADASAVFRVDLDSAVSHDIRVALGDVPSAQSYQYCDMRDTDTSFNEIDDTDGTAPGQWTDATSVTRTSESAWVNDNAAVTRVFTTTIFRVAIGAPDNLRDRVILINLNYRRAS